ncbi:MULTISPECIES: type II toxin-antitoxin system VapC family toxin [Methylorubrum]|uniref:type II toxin-antitoxin system VapC family toxin n=1 Tax=Methylorubrum TaxID=2282523 RepID=UPI001AE726FA|nr:MULTISPECIES: type II toxin-antitoxin system VapC family toxin [Methylorubrum]MCJ2032075.1 type II toxin-antitoxin system VapC family toxin [Methylobacterium sp. J-043]MCP1535583.1 ribonuclease VapC [Methylorubrum extorquens]MCP1551547.1 ribonuclease VapC [Methylorubrum zatmanii]MCP1556484.1 ribonuclease VapC [Methylorubrum extorquens]MCP1581855.1 ribonuclease VapC [Methylorubrum extorquens]
MFVDASALIAILTDEAEARILVARLQRAPRRITTPPAVWANTVVVARSLGLPIPEAREALQAYLALASIQVVSVPASVTDGALDAYDRYGEGRHPAALNFGDCLAYACARYYRLPLLYKGDGFARTDIEAA